MVRILAAVAAALAIAAAAVGGYELGTHQHRAVQLRTLDLTTGRRRWVTLNAENCSYGPHFIGRAACSWYGQMRVAP